MLQDCYAVMYVLDENGFFYNNHEKVQSETCFKLF